MSEFSFKKAERLCSLTAINRLFESGKSQIAYPLRMVYNISDRDKGAPVQIMVSIPKRCIRKAVDRVLMRRRVKEAYRLNRNLISELSSRPGKTDVAFIYMSDKVTDYVFVEQKMKKLLAALNSIKIRTETAVK